MILVGIDDTDTVDSRGTNQLAKSLAADLADRFTCHQIVRHQLLDDPRVPYTSRNGSASLLFEPTAPDAGLDELFARMREGMLADFVPGSDPGLCIVPAESVPDAVVEYGRRCQLELSSRAEAIEVASRIGVRLEGLGGTNDGVIGALAAIGLAATGDDGRIVHDCRWPDETGGPRSIASLSALGLVVQNHETGETIEAGTVDVGKKLRPNLRNHRATLLVRPDGDDTFTALKLP